MVAILRLSFIGLLLGLPFWSCSKHLSQGRSQPNQPGPRCIVYKTRADYSRNVPVILSADKSTIASFPDIRDISNNGKFQYPSTLPDGYLLDNRGIGPDVAFLKLTFEEYVKLPSTPSAAELMMLVVDRDPLTVMYDCGNKAQFSDPAGAMSELIRKGKLAGCKRLK